MAVVEWRSLVIDFNLQFWQKPIVAIDIYSMTNFNYSTDFLNANQAESENRQQAQQNKRDVFRGGLNEIIVCPIVVGNMEILLHSIVIFFATHGTSEMWTEIVYPLQEPHDMMIFHNLITRIDIISCPAGWVHFMGFCVIPTDQIQFHSLCGQPCKTS